MKTLLALLGAATAAVTLVWLAIGGSTCAPDSPHGPRIGSVIRLGGCP